MKKENSVLDCKNQQFYLGLDVHKNSWTVTIRSSKIVLKTFSMDPSPKQLSQYMEKNYPGGEYYSVYEAGFCGYWIHRELKDNGIRNIIAAPTEIPTSSNERSTKMDTVDSKKLARELESGSIQGIYIPGKLQEELRSLMRLRFQLVKSQSRLKNQIKGYLNFYGHDLPKNFEMRHWSRNFIEQLRRLDFNYPVGNKHLEILLEELIDKRKRIQTVLTSLRDFLTEYKFKETILLLCSVPGVGYTTAATIFTELMDINRFSKFDQLASYCGLVPAIRASGDNQMVLGLKRNHNVRIRLLLVEAAWMAIRKDPALTMAYNEYIKRMSKQEAIIKIAKKLLSRLVYVWKTGNKYCLAVVK